MTDVEKLGEQAIGLFIFSLISLIVVLCGLLWFGWWVSQRRGCVSPYTKQPMMYGVDLPVVFARQVEEFLKSLPQPENAPFDCTKAAICRQTHRIFPDCVKPGEIIALNWGFLQKRYHGNWVSWGAVRKDIQEHIKLHHHSLDGFQLEVSSPRPKPEAVDAFYANTHPGPLYVDVLTKIFLGWQRVPGTPFEVLVVKKPDFESLNDIL